VEARAKLAASYGVRIAVLARGTSMQLSYRRVAGTLILAGASFALLSGAARSAAAREEFPAVLADKLNMNCVPSCLPCHTEVPGLRANLRENGLALVLLENRVKTVASLEATLDEMLKPGGKIAPPGDSDGDVTPDLVELAAGQNPYGGADLCLLKYGCGASSIAPSAPARLGAFAFALAVTAALLRRRRRGADSAR
jgi:hypothetical protein